MNDSAGERGLDRSILATNENTGKLRAMKDNEMEL